MKQMAMRPRSVQPDHMDVEIDDRKVSRLRGAPLVTHGTGDRAKVGEGQRDAVSLPRCYSN